MATLEERQRLKDSLLWELQHCAYTQFGPDAWAKKGVPFYLTSNPLIAKQFSQVMVGYLRDCLSQMDPAAPLYIFDLGAGSGRLGYLVLKHLLPMVEAVFRGKVTIRYIMTDIAEANLHFWEQHPLLKKYLDAGVLDFAYYRHDDTGPLHLVKSGETLTKEALVNPIVLLCTYFFDTLPQDLFRAKSGRLEEGRVTLTVPGERREKLDPAQIMELEASYEYTSIPSIADYYPGRPELNALLREYADTFDDTPFLFPIGGFESIRYFQELSQGRMLLLAGDQGVCTEQQVRDWGEPEISRHASFSIAVSYHCLAKYFRNAGGTGLLTSFPKPQFVVMAAILGEGSYSETELAFEDHIDCFEPVDYWELTNIKPEHLEEMALKSLLALLKLGNWDPINFRQFYDAIRLKISTADVAVKEDLRQTIHYVWENCYPINPREGEFVMNLGVLLFELGQYSEALLFFQRAQELLGETRTLLMNMAQCHRVLGDSAAK